MRGNLGLFVSSTDRARLAAIVADRNSRQKHAQRAQVVLLTGERVGTAEVMRRTGLSKPSVWRWQERYIEAGVDGLLRDKTRPSRIPPMAADKIAEVVRLTLEEPSPADATHWTVRAMAARTGVSTAKVHEIWQENGWHRIAFGSSCPTIRPLRRRSRMWSGSISTIPCGQQASKAASERAGPEGP